MLDESGEGPVKPPEELGFGTRVSTGQGERLLNRDGTFGVRRRGLPWRAVLSLYHSLLVMSWPTFLCLLALVYVTVNSVFALCYLSLGPEALGGAATDTFERAFFFSVQTLSTVGYGHIVPLSLAANWVATVESFVGMLSMALVTGLAFARFSRPVADIVFSRSAVITGYRGITGFQFRIANQRRNQIIEPHVRVFLSTIEMRSDGARRSFVDLPLERDQLAFFPLSWTVVHPIDEESPLWGIGERELEASGAEFLITVNGLDETLSQVVHARCSYIAREIVWGKRFADIFQRSEAGTPRAIDLARIHDLE